ncbi:hypothetical protein ABPG72_018874 [Tetrahymena utriculariae]
MQPTNKSINKPFQYNLQIKLLIEKQTNKIILTHYYLDDSLGEKSAVQFNQISISVLKRGLTNYAVLLCQLILAYNQQSDRQTTCQLNKTTNYLRKNFKNKIISMKEQINGIYFTIKKTNLQRL